MEMSVRVPEFRFHHNNDLAHQHTRMLSHSMVGLETGVDWVIH